MISINKYLNFVFTKNALLLFLVFASFSCVREINYPSNKKLICDAEKINEKGDKFMASNDSSEFFAGAKYRSDLDSYSGDYSLLTIPKKNPFGLKYFIKKASPNTYFKVSVWRKSKDGKGALVVTSDNTDVIYLVTTKPVEVSENGWEKLQIEVNTPPHSQTDTLITYVWNNGSDSVFYDDFIIESRDHKQYPEYNYIEGLEIVLDTSDYDKIMKKRKKAFEDGILQTSDDDWVKSIIVDNDKAMKAKVRLKGDWLDHLWGDKWSYRVKMRKSNTFNRLRTFSLQTPAARSFLMEWLTHQLYHENDVLTTRYGFVPLMLNNKPRGIYVWEEHFVKQLPEWNNRREGPIVKFSEDPFWQIQKMNINYMKWPVFPFYQTAAIIPFGESRTVEDTVLYNQFLIAQKLMYQYKNQQKTPSELFDLNKLAKYYAMLELTHARHGMVWHNQRMYYNPVICKLEPIAFDGYTDHDEPDLTINDNIAYRALTQKDPVILQDLLIFNPFTDTVFLVSYLSYLDKFSSEDFVSSFMDSYESEAYYYDSLLRMEFPVYHYDDELLFNSAVAIREYLPELKQIIYDSLADNKFEFNIYQEVYRDTNVYENTPEFFVNVYTEKGCSDSLKLNIHNYYTCDLIFLGTGEDENQITNYFIDEPILSAYINGMDGQELTISTDVMAANYMFFMIKGRMDTYTVPIIPWPYPEGNTPQQELWEKVDLNNDIFDTIIGKDIFVKKGDITIDKPLIIPGGYRVNFSEGTKINIIDNAMIISYSAVFMYGTEVDPIVISSSDFTGNGFTVLQADEKSKLDNVIVENLNTLDYKSWTLTGALTFYESDVTITNTKFYRNQCEDALNIIRSDFTLNNSSFDYIYGDAFDADYCTGEIIGTIFTNIGNDAMDFSGSVITIRDSEVNMAEDKGISGGEDSKIYVFNTTIQKANIGLASKDLSVVEVTDSKVESCNYGIVLLQKKPEYGPSVMIINNTRLLDLKVEMLIEENSKVVIYGRTIFGKEKNLSDVFY